jgi:hypothetical protein
LIPRPPVAPVDACWIAIAGNQRGLVVINRLIETEE